MVEKISFTAKMKTLLLARPDHSIRLYENLRKYPDLDIKFHTFSAFKKDSWLSQWKSYVNTVDSEAEISYAFTIFHRLLYFLHQHFFFDYYNLENQVSEYFYSKILQKYTHSEIDIVHYWSVYCHKSIREFQRINPHTKCLADVYAAHPDYMHNILAPEYEKHGLPFENSYFVRSRERDLASLEGVENMVVPSEYMAEMYRHYYPKANVFVVNYGLTNISKSDICIKDDDISSKILKMVFVGKISIEKGCIYLLEAMKKLPNTEFHLDIIGDIEHNQKAVFNPYFNLLNVRFVGQLPQNRILEILPEYHLFVLPSLTDAYSLAVSEALSCKVPVIVTENVGNKDDIRKFIIGDVCEAQNVDALIHSILKLQDSAYRQFLRANIDNFIKENETKNYSSKVLKIYQDLKEEPCTFAS
jgi:glycosyltransferase involved in cell wall biosynthesis